MVAIKSVHIIIDSLFPIPLSFIDFKKCRKELHYSLFIADAILESKIKTHR